MEKPKLLICVCASFRAGGEPQGVCHKKGSADFLGYIENEIIERGLDAQVTSTGCMKACDHGPVMLVYPEGHWYGPVEDEETIDSILDAIEDGDVATDYLIAE